MPEKISIVKESGETINSNIVSVFMIPDTEKKYIITTENAVDPHGLTVLHVSEIVDGTLQKIATDEEWSTIKTIMRAIISGNVVSYKYIPPMEQINAVSQYSRDISVSASASKQMIDNYNAADKSETSTSATSPTPTPESDPQVAPVSPEQPATTVETQPQPNIPPLNSIFPSNNQPQSDNELIPGISEVSGEQVPIQPQVTPAQPGMSAPQTPIVQEMSIDPATGMPIIQTQMPQQFNEPVNPINPIVQPVDANPMNIAPIMPDNQFTNPAQVIPTGQIIQEAATPMMNPNAAQNIVPSFNPNATLDEVVLASQEMFMEGVRNLVQTIEEKVYRELYAKEAALKAREEALNQREQMIMAQPMMNYNLGMNNGMMQSNNMMMNQQPMNQMPINYNPQMGMMQQPINMNQPLQSNINMPNMPMPPINNDVV
ncbi:MAG TPA: hypothetical protein DCE23_03270 [Firmicutes bacterium]|nr:hypothetical protein [Bacillota bacterium]